MLLVLGSPISLKTPNENNHHPYIQTFYWIPTKTRVLHKSEITAFSVTISQFILDVSKFILQVLREDYF